MLILPIKKKWFDMILSGEKKEEYREIKPYYDSRLKPYMPNDMNQIINSSIGYFQVKYEILFRNGYSKNSPTIKCKVECSKGKGRPDWGADPNKEYYVLKILSVEEVKM